MFSTKYEFNQRPMTEELQAVDKAIKQIKTNGKYAYDTDVVNILADQFSKTSDEDKEIISQTVYIARKVLTEKAMKVKGFIKYNQDNLETIHKAAKENKKIEVKFDSIFGNSLVELKPVFNNEDRLYWLKPRARVKGYPEIIMWDKWIKIK